MAVVREPVSEIDGAMAVIRTANINTDAIIPSVWLRSAKSDFGKGLFGGLRYDADGNERPNFVLNRSAFRNATILLVDENFGCGSSREAAVWALLQFGIRCVLAPSFADIFYENAFRNGLVPGLVDTTTMKALASEVENCRSRPIFHVDLRSLAISGPGGSKHSFRVPSLRAKALMMGYDEIDVTMHHVLEIDAYYARSKANRTWLFPNSLDRPVGNEFVAE